jgi:hypothetical protein
MRKVGMLALLGALVLVAGVQAQDEAFLKLLDSSGLSYTKTKSGNYSVTYDLGNDRSQVVYMMGKTDTVDGMVLREIWSNAGYLGKTPDNQTLIDLLTGGGQESIGAWILENTDDGDYLAYYSAKLPDNLSAADLKSVLEYVANVADTKEAQMSDKDEN